MASTTTPASLPPKSGGGSGMATNEQKLGQKSVAGEPMGHNHWKSSLFACLGHNDEFCSSDIEVCVVGTLAPCVLYGGNVERLETGTFGRNCMLYAVLSLIGNPCNCCNCLTSWFSYHTRTDIRRKFNTEGGCEALNRSSCRCCGSFMKDKAQKEQCESDCDCVIHLFCHRCALCQETRELRRRMPPPWFNVPPVPATIPPKGQTMDRVGA